MGRTGGVAELIGWWKGYKAGHYPAGLLPIELMTMLDELQRDCDPCIAKTSKHEPIFVLRAQDKFAATLVIFWVLMVRAECGDIDKLDIAEDCAAQMEHWPHKKLPD